MNRNFLEEKHDTSPRYHFLKKPGEVIYTADIFRILCPMSTSPARLEAHKTSRCSTIKLYPKFFRKIRLISKSDELVMQCVCPYFWLHFPWQSWSHHHWMLHKPPSWNTEFPSPVVSLVLTGPHWPPLALTGLMVFSSSHRLPKRTMFGFGLQRSFGRNIVSVLSDAK